MTHNKRSRAAYEADLHREVAPHVAFGTPLPPLDPDVRDDGSYVPLHMQVVRDDRGRRRLHGAFTGGWSAGYFNTVGSKEGWTPATFISSRTNRRRDDPKAAQQRPEDYMDDEDLAEAAAAQEIRTTDPFAVLGASGHAQRRGSGLAGLMRIQGDTVGLRLLRKMGWKDGQGIGPKIRRKARLGVSTAGHQSATEETHLFAPEDVDMIAFSRKADRRGMGYDREARLSPMCGFVGTRGHQLAFGDRRNVGVTTDNEGYDGNGADGCGASAVPKASSGMSSRHTKQQNGQRGGFGVGVLNDTGSDEDDPYEMGPRISYNRVLGGGGAKKKKKSANTNVPANPTLRSRPVFISKSNTPNKGRDAGRCLDGKLPLNGFTLGQSPDTRGLVQPAKSYPLIVIPTGWVSAKRRVSMDSPTAYVSAADAAKAAHHDSRSRAAILGEPSLPGKSVFDYMSAASRERLAAASGRADLPPAKGEAPPGQGRSARLLLQERVKNLPGLAKETAIAAMTRGAGAGAPYAEDEEKRGRYRLYLQNAAGFGGSFPDKPPDMTNDEFINELEEFYGCAQLFKPMTGFMATRFTTASAGLKVPADSALEAGSNVKTRHDPVPIKPLDAAEEAAKMGVYGRMTRLTEDFSPTRLLCKRFNVRPPAHVQADSESGVAAAIRNPRHPLPSGEDMRDMPTSLRPGTAATGSGFSGNPSMPSVELPRSEVIISEATRPDDDVFRAIFGDSSDEEE